jgi:hypothetical protein
MRTVVGEKVAALFPIIVDVATNLREGLLFFYHGVLSNDSKLGCLTKVLTCKPHCVVFPGAVEAVWTLGVLAAKCFVLQTALPGVA